MSGVLYKPQAALEQPKILSAFPEVIQHLGLATPHAIDLLTEDPRLLQIIACELQIRGCVPWGRLFEKGLTFETFYGRGDKTCIGLYFTHRFVKPQITVIDGQRTAVVEMDQPEDPAFSRTIVEELEIYLRAKSLIYSLAPEGRDVFFGITGIATSGLETLSDDLYSALLARINNKYGLESLAAIRVLQDAGMIERAETRAEGLALTLSSGTLEREPDRAYPGCLHVSPSNITS